MAPAPWLTPIFLIVMALPGIAQKSVCEMVTPLEASTILPSADKKDLGRTCIYKPKGSTLSLVVTKKSRASADVTKANLKRDGATLRNEPDLSAGAYSASLNGSARIYLFKGDQMLVIEVVDSSKAKIQDVMMEKLRLQAKKTLDRF